MFTYFVIGNLRSLRKKRATHLEHELLALGTRLELKDLHALGSCNSNALHRVVTVMRG